MNTLEEIKENISGPSDDARFTGWMALNTSKEPEIMEEINKILLSEDAILKVLLLRFLAHVHEQRSIDYIRQMLVDHNIVVVDAAIKSFDKNKFDDKLECILSVIHCDMPKAQYFAIERLALGGVVKVADALLEMIDNANEELLLVILTALRHLANRQMVKPLKHYFYDKREKIRFKTLYALIPLGLRVLHKNRACFCCVRSFWTFHLTFEMSIF